MHQAALSPELRPQPSPQQQGPSAKKRKIEIPVLKRIEMSASDGSERPGTGDEGSKNEWVGKILEALGVSASYWDKTYNLCSVWSQELCVTDHLSFLSLQVRDLVNGINLSGEERYMEHNHVEDRRLNSDIVFEELDIGRASQCFGYLILMSHRCFIKT